MRPLLVIASVFVAGCSAGDPDKDQPLFIVQVLTPAGGTFTAMHRNAFGAGGGSGETMRGTGSFQEVVRMSSSGVDTSLQEIRGTFTGPSLVIGFGTRLVGGGAGSGVGAEKSSLQSVDGPHQQTLPCQVRYGPSAAAGTTYSVKFRLTGDRAKVCSEP